MDIKYTRHAKQRMRQRKVRQEQVTDTLQDPDDLIEGDFGELIAIKRYGPREVRVVYGHTDSGTIVIYTVINPRIHHPSPR